MRKENHIIVKNKFRVSSQQNYREKSSTSIIIAALNFMLMSSALIIGNTSLIGRENKLSPQQDEYHVSSSQRLFGGGSASKYSPMSVLGYANSTVRNLKKENGINGIGKLERQKNKTPPGVEDYVGFFSNVNRGAESGIRLKAESLRVKTISSIKRILSSKSLGQLRKFELLLRLGETYVERHDYIRGLEIESYSNRYDSWVRLGAKGKSPEINHSKSRKLLTLAVNSFRTLVAKYPKHSRTDAALFALAQTQSRLGNENAVMYYKQLLKSYPASKIVPDVHLALGEHYFEKTNLIAAIASYKKAMKFKKHRTYAYAIYKLGWAYFNIGGRDNKELKRNLRKSVAAFKLVIKLADARKGSHNAINLKAEAIKDLVVVWADAEDVKSAWAYFREIGKKKMFYQLLERLGYIYADQGKNKKAVDVLKKLLAESPLRKSNPAVYAKVAQLHDLLGDPEQVVADLRNMNLLYVGRTKWTEINTERSTSHGNESANASKSTSNGHANEIGEEKTLQNVEGYVAQMEELVRKNTHMYAALYHSWGQKNKVSRHMHAAENLYRLYLGSFPRSSEAYEIRFYLAEILHGFKRYREAAKHYILVSNQKNSEKTKNPDKFKKKSAMNAVIAINTKIVEQTKAGKYRKLPSRGRVSVPVVLPEDKKYLIYAIDNFARLFKLSKDTPRMLFTAADINFSYGYYPKSIKRFSRIIHDFPRSKQSDTSIKIILAYYVDHSSWQNVIMWSKRFLEKKNILSKKLDGFVRDSLRSSLFKYGLVLEKVGKRKDAAKVFIDFQREFPFDPSADKALYNASNNFYKIGDISDAVAAGSLILKRYKKSKLRADVMVAIGSTYEATAEFSKAADMYRQLTIEFPKDKRSERSLFNAAILYDGLGMLDESSSAFSRILQVYPKGETRGDVLLMLAKVQERRSKFDLAAGFYLKFYKKFRSKFPDRGYYAGAKAGFLMERSKNGSKRTRGRALINGLVARLSDVLATDRGQKKNIKIKSRRGFRPVQRRIEAFRARRVLAEGLFKKYEVDFTRYSSMKITDGSKIERQAGEKNKMLMKLAQKYQKIISLGNGEYSVASLFRMGQLHENLAAALFAAPAPSGAIQSDIDVFRSQLEKVAFPLKEDAYKYYETAYKRSREIETFSVWTKRTYEKMIEISPMKYKKIDAESVLPRYLSHTIALTKDTAVLVD